MKPDGMPNGKWLLLSIAALLIACTTNTVLHNYRHIGSGGWWRGDTLCFDLPQTDSADPCQIFLEMRITHKFPYTSLYILIEEVWDGQTVSRDTAKLTLANSAGLLDGRGVILMQYTQPAGNITLHPGEKGELRLTHLMDIETIPQIHDVGVRVERVKLYPQTRLSYPEKR